MRGVYALAEDQLGFQYGISSMVNQLLLWDVKVVLKLICTGLHSAHSCSQLPAHVMVRAGALHLQVQSISPHEFSFEIAIL